jgi:hypothetical protein
LSTPKPAEADPARPDRTRASLDFDQLRGLSTNVPLREQSHFDPALVELVDGQSQGALVHDVIKPGKHLAVSIDGTSAIATQGTLSTSYGFVDFLGETDAAVRVASPVAVAGDRAPRAPACGGV